MRPFVRGSLFRDAQRCWAGVSVGGLVCLALVAGGEAHGLLAAGEPSLALALGLTIAPALLGTVAFALVSIQWTDRA